MSRRPLVKICGITRAEDAQLAVRLGADRIGYVFADSPRRVDLDTAAAITATLPASVVPVGVFVNPTLEEVSAAFSCSAIRLAQLHGDETPSFCAALPHPWMKAIRVATADDVPTIQHFGCAEILVDTRLDPTSDPEAAPESRTVYGGTGTLLSDAALEAVLDVKARRIFLAGGLGPDTIGPVLEHAFARTEGRRPAGLDASSRLEASPGIKDPERLAGFFEEIERVVKAHEAAAAKPTPQERE